MNPDSNSDSDSLPDSLPDSPSATLRDSLAVRFADLGCSLSLASSLADSAITLIPDASAHSEAATATASRAESLIFGMLSGIALSDKPRLEARVCLMSLGIRLHDSDSLRRIGSDHGLTPEGVRKMILARKATYSLGQNQFNKSAAAVAAYRKSNGAPPKL